MRLYPESQSKLPSAPQVGFSQCFVKPQRPNLGAQGTTTQGIRRAKTLFLAEHGGAVLWETEAGGYKAS